MATPGPMTYTIQGVKVEFPCKPYPSQMSMMYKIICGLERKQNCLLESPTGSGKSLALLCAALAWQKAARERQKAEEKESKSDPQCCCQCKPASDSKSSSSKYFEQGIPPEHVGGASCMDSGAPNDSIVVLNDDDDTDDFKPSSLQGKLAKSGRPHVSPCYEDTAPGFENADCGGGDKNGDGPCCSCQQQNVKKKVRIPKIYFGTRTHKQIAQIAKELGRTAHKHVNMCILGSREHTCVHPEVSRGPSKNEECKLKLEGPGCRFFDNVRKISHRGLKNLGLYEAWDLEDFVDFCKKQRACPYFSSRQLKDGADIIFCPYNYLIDPVVRNSMEINLKDEIVILDEAHNIEDTARDAGSNSVSKPQLLDANEDLRHLMRDNVNPVEHGVLQDLLLGVLEVIDKNETLVGGGNFDSSAKVLQGLDIVAQLTACKVGPNDLDRYVKAFNKLMNDDSEKRAENARKMKGPTVQVIDGLLTVFDFLFRNNMMYINDYRVALVRTLTSVKVVPNSGWLNKRSVKERKEWTFTLNFWCMNPAVAFSDVSSVVRSIVLTSGTLSPMDSFASELGVPFEIQLEAAHVVGRSQVWVGTISKGPRGGGLLGSYQNSETFTYQDELGELLYRVCETVPHGVLCFLSSYKMMEKLSNRWKDTGLWMKFQNIKVVMTEPKASDKVDFDLLLKRYYDVIRESENPDKEDEDSTITGALFLAVCRGKVSEGMDFANNNARAVVAVGIPFPNVKDTQVNLKKEYNNMHSGKKGLLTGNEWYEIQAYRALNQALGRCIRHRQDWGALILVDERYAKNPKRYTKGLSKWVRQRIQYYGFFNDASFSLKEYTQKMLENPPGDQTNVSMFETTLDESVVDRTPLLQKPDFCNMPSASTSHATHQTSMNEFVPPQPVTPGGSGQNGQNHALKNIPVPSYVQNAGVVNQVSNAPPTLLNIDGKLILLNPTSANVAKPVTPPSDSKSKTLLVPVNKGDGAAVYVPVQLNTTTTPQPEQAPSAPPSDAKIVIMPDGKKVFIKGSFLPMSRGSAAPAPQPATPTSTIRGLLSNARPAANVQPQPSTPKSTVRPTNPSPSPLFNSQAGGFLSQASTQNSQYSASQTLNKLATTVIKGSHKPMKHVDESLIDFPDDLELEFNPSLASTQRSPGTPLNKVTRPIGQSTPVVIPAQKNLHNKATPKSAASKCDITIPDSPPLFDSEEPDSGPMDTGDGDGIDGEREKDCSPPPVDAKKVSVAKEWVVKTEPTTNLNKDKTETPNAVDKSKTPGNKAENKTEGRVSSRGRQIKPTYKCRDTETDDVKDIPDCTVNEFDDGDDDFADNSKSKPHNRSLSRRRLSRRSKSATDHAELDLNGSIDTTVSISVNEGKSVNTNKVVTNEKDVKKAETPQTKQEDESKSSKDRESSRSGGKRRRLNATQADTTTRKKPKGVVYDEPDDEKPASFRCQSCGGVILNDNADYHEKDIPEFLKPITKQPKCFLMITDALSNNCGVLTANKTGAVLNSHWSEEDGCVVQYLQCEVCQCWENDQGCVVGARVVHATGRAGPYRSGQVWLIKDSLSVSS